MVSVLLLFAGVCVLLALLIVGWGVSVYNSLISARNLVRNAWAQIDVQLKRRHDLIPNLVETVKGYAKHEKETLEAVIAARSAATSAQGPAAQGAAERGLSGALGRMMLLVEQYPDLKANQSFLAVQEELTSTENKIGFSRQHYNDSVMLYNTKIESVPANFVASAFRFGPEELFEIEAPAEREAPKVSFS